MRLIFMGSPDFAVPSLQALLDSQHEVIAVYTQPPRPAGRGKKLRPTPIHTLADAHHIPVFTPERLKGEALDTLRAQPCDAIAVVAYGLLLPQAVLDHAPCLNVHPSALPRWRGPAPLQHTLLAGDTSTEVCIMQLDIGMDTGPVYKRVPTSVGDNETLAQLHDRLAQEGAHHLVDVLDHFDTLTPVPQPEEGVSIAPKITPDMRPIDWTQPAQQVHNHIRGMSPFPSATAVFKDETWKILGSTLAHGAGLAGTILSTDDAGIVVACGDGAVRLTTLQRPGKKAQPAKDFLKGTPLHVGDCFFA